MCQHVNSKAAKDDPSHKEYRTEQASMTIDMYQVCLGVFRSRQIYTCKHTGLQASACHIHTFSAHASEDNCYNTAYSLCVSKQYKGMFHTLPNNVSAHKHDNSAEALCTNLSDVEEAVELCERDKGSCSS